MKNKKYLVIEEYIIEMLIKDNNLDRKNKDNTEITTPSQMALFKDSILLKKIVNH